MAFPAEVTDRVPLEGWQKIRLITECIPVVFFAVLGLIFISVLREPVIKGLHTSPIVLYLFLGLVLVVLGYQAVQRLRDLLSGVALVKEDTLERSWRTRSGGRGGSAHYYGKFMKLGKLRVMPKAHFQSYNGQHYRVIYSPVSRIVWTLEPLE
jgi:hypothetical protein